MYFQVGKSSYKIALRVMAAVAGCVVSSVAQPQDREATEKKLRELMFVAQQPPGVDCEVIAKKIGAAYWGSIDQQRVDYELTGINPSRFTPQEVEFLLAWARYKEFVWPDSTRQGCRISFKILVKFKDKKTLDLLEKQFAKGWYWAAHAAEALEESGELSLLYLPAKFLEIETPSEARPPMGDLIFAGPPCVYAARCMGRMLRFSWQSPERVQKAARIVEFYCHSGAEIYRRWWKANEQCCAKGDFRNLSSPIDCLTSSERKNLQDAMLRKAGIERQGDNVVSKPWSIKIYQEIESLAEGPDAEEVKRFCRSQIAAIKAEIGAATAPKTNALPNCPAAQNPSR